VKKPTRLSAISRASSRVSSRSAWGCRYVDKLDGKVDPGMFEHLSADWRKQSSIWIAQNVERKMRNFLGHKFWARGYFVTTVGRDEEVIRAYITNQELADRQLEQFELKISAAQNPINRPNIP
jgi:REP element-mobilizing transposase RayT